MGEAVYKREFSPAEYREFSIRIERQLGQLHEAIRGDSFSRWLPTIGAELEVYLADAMFEPAAVNEELLKLANHGQLTPELNKYNLEFNMTPVRAEGACFMELERELRDFLGSLQDHAKGIGGLVPQHRLVREPGIHGVEHGRPVGPLPRLEDRQEDLLVPEARGAGWIGRSHPGQAQRALSQSEEGEADDEGAKREGEVLGKRRTRLSRSHRSQSNPS